MFCKHSWEVTESEVTELDSYVGFVAKKGVKRFWNCSTCGKHKERWLYITYKR